MILTVATEANLLGLGAAAAWGVSDFCGGLATKRAFPSLVVAMSHGLSFILLLLLIHFAGAPALTASTLKYGLLSGVAGGIGLMMFYEALASGAMGLSSALAGVITPILPIAYQSLYHRLPSIPQMAGFALALIAIWMIAYAPAHKPHPRGLVLAAISGVGFGLMLLFLEKAGHGSVLWALASSRLASASIASTLTLLLFARGRRRIFSDYGVQRQKSRARRWLSFIPLVAFTGSLEVSGNFSYTLSSVIGRLDIASVLSSLYPAITILLAAWILRERATRTQIAGMALALGAVVLISC